jgi:predicted branched-subunit amino acid permease
LRTESSRRAFRKGARQGIPFAIAGFLLSVSFGVVAQDAGLSPLAAIVMSLIVFAGSAQFAAIAIVGGGGTVGAAIGAAALMNSRFLPMGAALGPSLPGGPAKRAAQGQAVVDASWALAGRGDGSFDRWLLFGATATQYVTWQLGTIGGALGGDLLGDPDKLGLDAIYPAFFLGLLLAEARTRRAVAVAALGACIALALVPFAPAGVPILAASVAALVGLTRSAQAAVAAAQESEGAPR